MDPYRAHGELAELADLIPPDTTRRDVVLVAAFAFLGGVVCSLACAIAIGVAAAPRPAVRAACAPISGVESEGLGLRGPAGLM